MDPQSEIYLRYYTAQSGGQLPAFHGARRTQYGTGFGDKLGRIWRTEFPIALHGIGKFIHSTLRARETGFGTPGASPSCVAAAQTTLDVTRFDVLKLLQQTHIVYYGP